MIISVENWTAIYFHSQSDSKCTLNGTIILVVRLGKYLGNKTKLRTNSISHSANTVATIVGDIFKCVIAKRLPSSQFSLCGSTGIGRREVTHAELYRTGYFAVGWVAFWCCIYRPISSTVSTFDSRENCGLFCGYFCLVISVSEKANSAKELPKPHWGWPKQKN